MTPDDHKLLSETAKGTPMGELLRRYWMPAVLSRELIADGAPVRVELCGEKLIAFRNSDGKVGLLREFCAHRGASLSVARAHRRRSAGARRALRRETDRVPQLGRQGRAPARVLCPSRRLALLRASSSPTERRCASSSAARN